MTARVSESEQGQLQGANASVASIAGVLSPLFFGAVYSLSLGDGTRPPAFAGIAFLIAAFVLLGAAVIGWRVARRVASEARSGGDVPSSYHPSSAQAKPRSDG
jgi:DHA1 family tetracycline resistance protein-like MFS transporter